MDYAYKVYTDASVAKQYRDQRFTDGPMSKDETPCEFHECQNKWFCQITSGNIDEYIACMSGMRSPWLEMDFILPMVADKLFPNWYEYRGTL